MPRLILIPIALLLALSQPAFATTSIHAEIKGMVCAFCAKGISKKLNQQPATQQVLVDLKRRTVVVELKDQQQLGLADFNKIIQDAGYDVGKVEYVDKSLAQLKSELHLDSETDK